MKKLAFLIVLMAGLISQSFVMNTSQSDPKAQKILDDMSNKYKTMSGFTAKFAYTLENDASKIKESSEGEITVKGSKFKLKLKNQEIFNNGTTVWTYMKESNEVNVSTYDPGEDDMNPTKIYTIYKNGYKYILMGEQNGTSIVDLEPLDRKKTQLSKVRLVINKADKTIKSWKIFEKNGNRYDYTIKTFTPNKTLDDKEFTFDKSKYPGVEVIDLR